MRVKTQSCHLEGLNVELDPLASFDGVGKDDGFASGWELLDVANYVSHSFFVAVCVSQYLFQSFWQEKKRALVDYLWLVRKFGP